MTAFTTVPDDVLEPGDPIRSIDIIALRDNPIAMFEGAAGAPRLVGNAVSLFPGTYPVLTVTASDAVSVINGLGTTQTGGSSTSTANPPTDVRVRHVPEKYTGTIRFRASFGRQPEYNQPDTYRLAVRKNGTILQEYSVSVGVQSFTPLTAVSIDISVVPNDEITWAISSVQNAAPSRVNNGNNTASNGYLLRELFAPGA